MKKTLLSIVLFVAAHHPRRYVALFGKDVDENDLSAMNPIPKIKSGMAPLLCSHATKDRVVSIVSHRAFADAYRAAGNACEFFEYPNSIREGLTGHCIWIPDSDPQRLIPEIEARIKAFFAQPGDKAPAVVSTEIKILEPAQGAVVPLLTDAQKAYFDIPTAERRIKFRDVGFRKQLARSGERASDGSVVRQAYWPKTVRLAWTPVKGTDAYTVTVKDAKKGETVVDETVAGTSLEIDNFEVAADYVWTVAGGGSSARGTFKTEDRTPRFIRYPGVPNVRDLGGWIGLGGRRVRQGMITMALEPTTPAPGRLAAESPSRLARQPIRCAISKSGSNRIWAEKEPAGWMNRRRRRCPPDHGRRMLPTARTAGRASATTPLRPSTPPPAMSSSSK